MEYQAAEKGRGHKPQEENAGIGAFRMIEKGESRVADGRNGPERDPVTAHFAYWMAGDDPDQHPIQTPHLPLLLHHLAPKALWNAAD